MTYEPKDVNEDLILDRRHMGEGAKSVCQDQQAIRSACHTSHLKAEFIGIIFKNVHRGRQEDQPLHKRQIRREVTHLPTTSEVEGNGLEIKPGIKALVHLFDQLMGLIWH